MLSYLKKLLAGERISYLVETVQADIFYYDVFDLDNETYVSLQEESHILRTKVRFMAEKGYKVVGHYVRQANVYSEKDRKDKSVKDLTKCKKWEIDVLYFIMQSSQERESSFDEIRKQEEKELKEIKEHYSKE
jgi:hypothetical protein